MARGSRTRRQPVHLRQADSLPTPSRLRGRRARRCTIAVPGPGDSRARPGVDTGPIGASCTGSRQPATSVNDVAKAMIATLLPAPTPPSGRGVGALNCSPTVSPRPHDVRDSARVDPVRDLHWYSVEMIVRAFGKKTRCLRLGV